MRIGYKETQRPFGGDENVLKLDWVMTTQFCKFTKNHLIIHIKWMHIMLCKSEFNKVFLVKNL